MKKASRLVVILFSIAGVILAGLFFVKSNQQSLGDYATDSPYITTIENVTVATGKVIPEDEVVIVPQLSGIIDKLYVDEGDVVKSGDLIAKIKVVPDEAALNAASGRLINAKLVHDDAQLKFKRNKALYEQNLISIQAYDDAKLGLSQAKQNYDNAKNDVLIIEKGTAGGGATNTIIRATVSGTVLEIPVEQGDQVIESNVFNAGTTIATVANLNKMIFEGKVDEADVDNLKIGMPLSINLAAIKNKVFEGKLRFVAPKGKEEAGTVQFTIRADIYKDDNFYVRAGYSANATMVLEKKADVLAIKEALLQFDKTSRDPYVEVKTGDYSFERRDIKLGISDGLQVEILSGLNAADKIKVWNRTEALNK